MDALLILVGVAGLFVLIWWRRSDPSFHSSASSAQAIVTAAALLIAGYWYFIERKGQPHANVTQTVEVHRLSSEILMVEVHVTVENLGQRLLRLRRARVRLQQVTPPRYDVRPLLERSGEHLWNSKWSPSEGRRARRVFSAAEYNWPIIQEYNGTITNDIEPGEKDLIVATFFVRCGADVVRIATNVEKERNALTKPLMWKTRSFANVRDACRR